MVPDHQQLLFPLSLPVGLVAGYGLHFSLTSSLLGTVAMARSRGCSTSDPLLSALVVGTAIEFSRFRTAEADLFRESGVDVATGEE